MVREADSLAAAGHDVRVVAPSLLTDLEPSDAHLVRYRRWRLDQVRLAPTTLKRRAYHLRARWRRRFAQEVFHALHLPRAAEIAQNIGVPELTQRAIAEPADWFIAHTQGALAIAGAAARQWNARLAFDCEDLLSLSPQDDPDIVRQLERRYIGSCVYVSTASEAMAEELRREYGIDPVVLYNALPTRLAESLVPPHNANGKRSLRLHWFSQTIGPGRGLEEVVEVAGTLNGGIEMHLLGRVAPGFGDVLSVLARRHGVPFFYHPIVHHDDLIRVVAQYDVGLAVEQGVFYDRTVTNKLFSYMLAGLAIVATNTRGQCEIMRQAPGIGFTYDRGDTAALAAGLRVWRDDREKLTAVRRTAWELARKRYCWDIEQEKFFAAVGINGDCQSLEVRLREGCKTQDPASS